MYGWCTDDVHNMWWFTMMYDDVCNITHIANLTKMGKKLKNLLPIIKAVCYLNIILKYDIYSWISYMFNATYTVLFF